MLRSCLADHTSGHIGTLTSAEEQALCVEAALVIILQGT